MPADEEMETRLTKVMYWAAREYGKAFRIANMSVIEGVDAALQAIQSSGEGQVQFKKLAIKHPLAR
jgi:ABC-type amino acid transport substrate-binding protein